MPAQVDRSALDQPAWYKNQDEMLMKIPNRISASISERAFSALKGRLRRVKKATGNISSTTYRAVIGYVPQEVVVPILFMRESSGSIRWPCSIRSSSERLLPGEETSLMEQMRLDEKILKEINDRRGKKHEKLIKVCHRCLSHELGYRTKGFKERVAEIFELRAAFEYPYKQLEEKRIRGFGKQRVTKKKRVYGVVFEQVEKIAYSWNKKEISEIKLTAPERFKNILTSQVIQLIPSEPPGDRENLKWLIDRVVNLNFDFGPYTLPLRSVHRRKAKGVYPMPIKRRV